MLIAGSSALIGCGDERASDEVSVSTTWSEFAEAALSQDGETACARLSTEAADGGLAREVGLPVGNGCEEMLGGLGGAVVVPLDVGETLENVTVEGGTATGEAGAANPTFVDEDGEWKVETLYGGEPAGG